ncbi:D-alanyl-D-alanine carboxypeptidase [Streptomyces sp. NPDC001250]|uniref:D-alanyl-D-alanine carboxypeptidase n=1 Tax=Streptomyces sp. NPDC001250 TaxID=3154382 RepID=UPI003326072F
MAGESPDRSKQRESSAEPTSGSADPVPETRDPRLAVTREKDSAPGSVDTATKILSIPDAKPTPAKPDTEEVPAQDAALRKAVSAWVRKAAPANNTDTPANTPTTGPTATADAKADTETEAENEADNGTAEERKADTEAAGADAKANAETAGAKAGTGAGARTDGDGETADAGVTAESKADADTKAHAPQADSGSGAKAGAGAGVKADEEAETPDAEAKSDAGSETADAEAATGADAKAEAGEDGETAHAEAGAAASDAGVQADAAAKAGRGAAADAEARAEADVDAEADSGSDAEGEPKAAADEAEGKTEKAKDGRKTGDGTKAGRGTKAGDGAESQAGPEDADGGDDPQGPPAADDETRTGGAGGNHAAEAPQVQAQAQAQPIDQPTAVFKAVKPKQVDQPTTMLKLGGKPGPRTPESESERTSKFVALKNDMAPKPEAKPAAKPEAKPDVTTPVPQVGPERTTQQPLPPKPPLDLLAELTNTPPPPETAVRTIVRRVKIWTPLVLILAIIFAVVQAVRPLPSPSLVLSGKDSYTFDGGAANLPWPGEGQGWMDVDGIGTMGTFGKQTPVAIGSVAKTMTSYIILRDHPLKPGQEGPRIKVDPQAEKEGGYDKHGGESTLNTVKAGQYLTEKQALSAVMIPSANNIARLLARWDAGSEAAFVEKMNATAKELGMTDTTYTDPSGLKETTVSTAADQVKLGHKVVKNPALVAITSAASWTDPSGRNWPNVNTLPYLIGAIGIKTGSTTAAGGNLLFAARKTVGGQTVTIVGAILGQHKPYIIETVNAVSKTALLAAQSALTSANILKKGDVVGYVDDQLGGQTPIVVTKDVTAVGWSGLKVKLSFTSGTVPHTAAAGTTVGTLTVGDGSGGAVKVPVALQQNLSEPGFGAKLTRLG